MLGLLVGSLVLQLLTAVLPAAAIGMEDFRTNAIASAALAATSVLVVVATIRALDVAALGLGQMVAMVISRAYLLRWSRRRAPWLNLRPERPRRAAVTALLSFSGPMVLLAIAAQLVAWTDVVSVGALVGASASALYRAGSIVPTQATGLIWRTYDVVVPLLSRSAHADQERATSLLTRVFSALSGVIFAAIIAVRQDIISVVTGGRSGLAEFVLVSFCLIWAVNVPAHGLSLLAIARGKHGLYVPVVLVEVVFNIVLTVVLVSAEGARGAAVATLVTILVSNLVAIPLVLRGAIPSAFTLTIVDGVLPLMLYGTVSLVALSMLRTLDPTAVRLVLQGGVALILCSAAVAFGGGATGRRALRSSLRRHEPV
jgi:O-antigen/teichoic acid export membrane protein